MNSTTTRETTVPDQEPDREAPARNRAVAGLRVIEAPAVLRAQLGLGEEEGVVVDLVDPAGPAAAAGILPHDILLSIDARPVGRPAEFREVLSVRQPGDEIGISLLRKGRPGQAKLTLAAVAEGPEHAPDAPPFAPEAAAGNGREGLQIEIKQGGNEALEMLLNDPDVPEDLKEMLRKSGVKPQRREKR